MSGSRGGKSYRGGFGGIDATGGSGGGGDALLAAGLVGYGSAGGVLTGQAQFGYSAANKTLTIDSSTSATGLAVVSLHSRATGQAQAFIKPFCYFYGTAAESGTDDFPVGTITWSYTATEGDPDDNSGSLVIISENHLYLTSTGSFIYLNTAVGGAVVVNQGLTVNGTFTANKSDGPAYFAHRLQAADGSSGSPTYSFSSDTDTGMYRVTANYLALVAGGQIIFYGTTSVTGCTLPFDAEAGIRAASGLLATPGLAFIGDLDTGLYRVAANDMAVTVGGTQMVRWNTTGIGFFASAPIAKATSGADLTNSVTAGGTNNVIDNWSNLSTYSTDAAAIRNAVHQLARKLKQVNDALRAYGLLT